MNDSQDAIHRIIEAFERSDWSEIDIRSGDVHVHLTAHRHDGGGDARAASTSPAPRQALETVPTGGDEAATRDIASDRASDRASDVASDGALDGAHIVVAPSPGIFWSSPAPGLPAFASVGDAVDPSTTLCIVEVMKLMSHLKAGVTGELVAVYGRNGERVQKGEALFAIAPAGSVP